MPQIGSRWLFWLLLVLWATSGLAYEIQPRSLTKTGFPAPSGNPLSAAEYDNALFGLSALAAARGTLQTLTASSQIDCRSNAIVPVAGSGGPVTLTSNPQLVPPTDLPTTKLCLIEGTSATNTVTLVNGNGLVLGGPVTLGLNQVLLLAFNGTSWVIVIGGGSASGTDNDAIHDNVPGEIVAIADKVTPAATDHLLIEDVTATPANSKRDITIGSMKTALETTLVLSNLQGVILPSKLSGDYGEFSCNGSTCVIEPNAVDLTTDTVGNYVSSATPNQGLLMTGTEGGSLGLMACSDTQILKNVGGTSWACAADATGAGGSDSTAIHNNVANEIAIITDKPAPIAADHLLIENSAASNVKRHITIGSMEAALESVIDLADLQGTLPAAKLSADYGDFTCNGTTCTIDPNTITLTTQTVGDYVAGVTANQGLLKTGTEAATLGLIACTAGQILKNSGGTSWACAADDSGGGSGTQLTMSLTNATTTGTIANKLVVLTGAPSTGIRASITDIDGVVGVCLSGCGTTSSATVVISGSVQCDFDGATTAGHYVSISATVDGECHDAGNTVPTSGQIIGQVLQSIGAAGLANIVFFGSGAQDIVAPTPTMEQVKTAGSTVTSADTIANAACWGNGVNGTVCIYVSAGGTRRVRYCDQNRANCITPSLIFETGSDRQLQNEEGDVCQTQDSITGLITFSEAGNCGADPHMRRTFHATNCSTLTGGKSGELCWEQDQDALFVCEPTAGDCDTTAEWIKLVKRTETRMIQWGAYAMSVDGTQCTAPEEVNISAAAIRDGAVLCPMAGTETDGAIYGSAMLPACYDGGTVTFTIQAILDTDSGAGTFHGHVSAQSVSNTETVSSYGSPFDLDLVEAAGDVQWDQLETTSAAVTILGTPAPGETVYWRWRACDADTTPSSGCTSSTNMTDFSITRVVMHYTCVIGQ